ncbi:potassium channel family protein [Puerhibacterium puerhi]|uniref:potassium channel family protein n=1 Tax=Puerhibacterium puerhi TaxID=2692623 RepID=UPI00191604C3|nr:potassium channel family protein [Puerhibacterium puerhi]
MPPAGPGRDVIRLLTTTTVVLALLTAAYFLLPLRFEDAQHPWLRLTGAVAALAGLGVLLARNRRRIRRLPVAYRRIERLLTALYVLVLAAALVYYAVATLWPGQFVGLRTRTDALYFAVTVVSTVGFGDIHAAGTGARLVVTVHMLFDLIYLGTAVRLLSSAVPAPAPAPTTAPETADPAPDPAVEDPRDR